MFEERIQLANGRILSRRPTAEIAELMRIRPKLIETRGGGICEAATVNLSGALILEWRKSENIALFESEGLVVPEAIRTPVQIISDSRIFNFVESSHYYTGFKAPKILYKTPGGSGIKGVGVVLEGPMAGLYTRPFDEADLSRGMAALRVGNDAKLVSADQPYTTEIDNPYLRDRHRAGLFRRILEEIDLKMLNDFYKLQTEMEDRNKGEVYASDMLFELLERYGIKPDREAFHFSRKDTVSK